MKKELKETISLLQIIVLRRKFKCLGFFFNLRNKVFPQKTAIQCQHLIHNKSSAVAKAILRQSLKFSIT